MQANGTYRLTVGNDCGLFTVYALLEMAHAFTDNRALVLPCQRQIYEFRHRMANEILTALRVP